MYYFYILRCRDDSLYAGITTDIERRLREHNSHSGKAAKYTRAKQPVTLVYVEQLPDLSHALKREAEVKRWPKQKKEAIIRSWNSNNFNNGQPRSDKNIGNSK